MTMLDRREKERQGAPTFLSACSLAVHGPDWWGERPREPERGCVEDQPQRLGSKPNAGVSGPRAAADAAHTAALLQRHRPREPEAPVFSFKIPVSSSRALDTP